MIGVLKLWLALASTIVLLHSVTPHYHHISISAALSQWDHKDHKDDPGHELAHFQMDHHFESVHSFLWEFLADMPEMAALTEIMDTPAAHVRGCWAVFRGEASDNPAAYSFCFRGPPAALDI